jgi:hypothetical protein
LKVFNAPNCPQLTELALMGIASSGAELQKLDLTALGLHEAGGTWLSEAAESLTTLKLHNCSRMADGTLHSILSRCKSLVELDLSGCSSVTDDGLVGVHLLQLRTLNISGCLLLGNGSIRSITEGCPSLLSINVAGMINVSDAGLEALGKGAPLLESLTINGASKYGYARRVTEEGLRGLVSELRALKHFVAPNMRRLGDQVLRDLARRAHRLEELNVAATAVTGKGLIALSRGCPALRLLNATGVQHVSDRVLVALGTGCPRLRQCLYVCVECRVVGPLLYYALLKVIFILILAIFCVYSIHVCMRYVLC